MHDEGLVPGIDGPTPGLGELGIDAQSDVQSNVGEPAVAGGHYRAHSLYRPLSLCCVSIIYQKLVP